MEVNIKEYNKYLKFFFEQSNDGRTWPNGRTIFARAYQYHAGDWQKTLTLAQDFNDMYSLGSSS